MEQNIGEQLQKKLDEQTLKIDAIYTSVEKTRRYFLIITWITIVAIVVPLIGLFFAIPSFLGNYANISNILGN